MSKLPKEHRFLDVSDYGRPVARLIANSLKNTSVTPIHVTIWFIISGFLAIYCILEGYSWLAAFFLTLKSILDAADGELSRVKSTPSHTGRYLDSVADIILNFFFLLAICHVTNGSIILMLLAWGGIQLQGTLYNFYYVILRNNFNGDKTSRIFEDSTPVALPGEKQEHVDILFKMYMFLYSIFDKLVYRLDPSAPYAKHFPTWFMTAVSTFGLGFQLLIMAIMGVLGLTEYIIPFFILFTIFIPIFIIIRKVINQ